MSIDSVSAPEESPLFTVVAGNPTPEELAALAVVVLGLQSNDDGAPRPAAHRSWVRRDQLRLGPRPGPGSWRRSALR
ncbi:Acyl-CoA carboxylase epsilon subunit [Arthrobacter subterraneus]|uniref:Acyl-CoA carboxylase epsilon subunit n=1 Tax=Arthrobacter subterraneus TaxID=335973 RepID=A0A1G8GMX4_9MICC|nr:acyl-CoA carboxylase subunit epsilon [Arthrobacter subterraneus]SDH95656.1 Acyl-CoA carboxylase epsilon subunit [Arthrobacter subterraneus]